jgi:type I restriction enzyme M protein
MKLPVAKLMDEAGLPPVNPDLLIGHEDNVIQSVLVPLLRHAGYCEIYNKPTLSHAIIGEPRAPDVGVAKYRDSPSPLFGIVADAKRTDVALSSKLEEKLAGYCGLAGASYGILTNGIDLIVIQPKSGVVDWDYLSRIPTAAELMKKIERRPPNYPIPHIIYAGRVTEEITESTIETLAKRCHEIIRSRKGMAVPDRLYEFSKLLITRILDERRFAEKEQPQLLLTAPALDELQERKVDVGSYVNSLFAKVKDAVGIFDAGEGIDLPADVIQQMVRYLDQFPLWSKEIDVLGQVYEKFLVKTMTGQELGQFFTPRPIVQAMVQMVDPSRGEVIVDPACGSGGFLIHSLIHLKTKYASRTATETRKLAQRIRGIDIFKTATKLCQINLFLHGDCHDNVARADSLDPDELPEYIINALLHPEKDGIDCVITNPPFGAKEGTRIESAWTKAITKKWHGIGVNMFECGIAGQGFRDLQPQSPFAEMCVKMLKKPKSPGLGGRLGIVIDNGLLSNLQKEEPVIRSIIRRECIIEAVIGLPKGTFKPYGSNVIPDFLIVRRRHAAEQQGPIFRADALQIGLVPGMGSYKEAPDRDLRQLLLTWNKWKGKDTGIGGVA